jgi:tyrosine-protein kinase Etk/Wzc
MPEDMLELSRKKQIAISPREIIFKYLKYLPWVVISVAFMLVLAYIKLRYSTPVFSINGKMLVKKNSSPYSNGGEKFDDIFMMQGGSNSMTDEIEIIKSRLMAARVAKSLGLQLQFYGKGKIRTSAIIHPLDMPFWVEMQDQKDSAAGFMMEITAVNNNQFRIGEAPALYSFGQWVTMPFGKIRLSITGRSFQSFSSNQFIISYQPLEDVAAGLSGGIMVVPSGDYNSNVLSISYQTENIKWGLDIVNKFMQEYQQSGLEDKRQIAVNTLAFIDDQLHTVKLDLGSVERNLQNYKEEKRVFNPELQSQLYFSELSESGRQLTEQGVKLKVADYLIKYIANIKEPFRTVPSTLGIEEPSLVQQITEFNRLQLQRELALQTTTEANPLIREYESGIEKLRTDMVENLQHIRQTYTVAITDLNKKNQEADNQIRTMPGKQKELLEGTRQQKILEELYSYLLQKRLETSISSASTISNIKVLEPARAAGTPVSPDRKSLYTLFLFAGIALPLAIIFLLEYLNDKVKTKADIEKITDAPILGEIGHAEEGGALVVTKNNRQFIAEQFRIIRSNMQYILPKTDKPVIMVTSSFSGEGKSFISTNLGAVLAISGKRTVILEFDIRKPKIMEGLGLSERKGITNYIVGNLTLNEIIYPVPGQDNLFVVPCGPVPPNPSEMLLDEKVTTLFASLKQQFDVVIVDTAPVGLVSDAITLGQHANAAMYLVRHNYTFKKQVQLIDEIYTAQKLPHLAIIINDINSKGGYGGYGYGYGSYGYGYGNYGYGYGAGFDEKTGNKKKGLLAKIKNWFS